MNAILISYDLRSPGRNYGGLYEHLKSYPDYISPLESVWVLKTSSSVEQVRDAVLKYLDTNDGLLVLDITGDAGAWYGLTTTHSKWLKENL